VTRLVIPLLALEACQSPAPEQHFIPDYRNSKPNALVCPDGEPFYDRMHCFQCDHATALRYAKLLEEGKWDGGIVLLPFP
jgi:hypothetical protein